MTKERDFLRFMDSLNWLKWRVKCAPSFSLFSSFFSFIVYFICWMRITVIFYNLSWFWSKKKWGKENKEGTYKNKKAQVTILCEEFSSYFSISIEIITTDFYTIDYRVLVLSKRVLELLRSYKRNSICKRHSKIWGANLMFSLYEN